MKVTLDREGKNIVRIGLELEAEKASRAYEITCRELSHRVEIPGFRKGKAPRNIIEKRFGRDIIKQEALERLIPELLQQVITDKSLDIITSPEIEECKFELGEPLTLQAKFEVRPDVELGNYRGIKVNVPEAKLPDDAMDMALKNIAEQRASLTPIEGREVETGDHVLLDFECFVDDELVEGGKAEGLSLEVKEGAFLPGFSEQLVGKKPGEEFEVNVTFPEDYRNAKLAGKPSVFKVILKELRQKTIPTLDDELAKSLGQESLDDLKRAIEARMQMEIDQENRARSQRLVVEEIVKTSNVDIPDTMIEREHDLLMRQLKNYVEQNGQDWVEYEKSDEFKRLRSGQHEEAKQRVLHSLVLGAIVRKEDMVVLEEEVAPMVAAIAEHNQIPHERLPELWRDEFLMRQVTEDILTNKVVDFLVENAEVTYVPEESVKTEEETSEEPAKEEAEVKEAVEAEKKD
ncbi:MAG: trigger factor [Cyanobacteria bacterium]|nr:trigger factor [Cyanobacteriota bacterium]